MAKPRIIALYLPQYHPFPENDEWWGKGFTEWRSVTRAQSLFKGHNQPNVPADLGYYDLRLPIVRQQQADLAKEAGIEGFCYWHYWFGNGKQLMNNIIDEIISTGKPDFPFCLGWANHSWYAKNWSSRDTKGKDRLLIEQTFPGDDDIRKHYEYVLKAFKDPRYIKVGNKPFFMIYVADDIPNNFISLWNKWAVEDGFDGIYFVGNVKAEVDAAKYIDKGFCSVIKNRIRQQQMQVSSFWKQPSLNRVKRKFLSTFFNYPYFIYNYKDSIKVFFDEKDDSKDDVIPNLIPNFDHSPRSGKYGYIIYNSTPELFKIHAEEVLDAASKKRNNIVMLRSWNEWGEGNYMEPDLKWGKAYINVLHQVMKKYMKE